jgi:stress-induced morphogen
MPEKERSLFLARLGITTISESFSPQQRIEREREVYELLRTAKTHGTLSKREARTLQAFENKFSRAQKETRRADSNPGG